jgi:hypothetical protein
MTKVSLKQLRSNENILHQRSEDRTTIGTAGYNGGVNHKSDEDALQMKAQTTIDYSRPSGYNNNTAGAKSV